MHGNTTEQLRHLNACIEILVSIERQGHSLEDGLEEMLTIICEQVGRGEITGTLLYTPSERITIGYSWSPQTKSQREKLSYELERGLVRVAQRKREPISVSDVQILDVRPRGYVEYSNTIRAEIAVPLLQGDRVVGVIDVGSSLAEAFGEDDKEWPRHIASTFQLLRGQKSSTETISELMAGKSIEFVLDTILKQALKIIKLPDAYASILLVDDDRVIPKHALIRSSENISVDVAMGTAEWSQLRGITGRALREKKMTIVQDVNEDEDYFDSKENHPYIVRSEAVFPILWGPQWEIVGALNILLSTTYAFTKEMTRELQAFAEQNSFAIYTAQRAEVLKREQSVLDKLTKVTPSVVKSYDIHFIYDLILEATFNLLPTAIACQIFETDRQTRQGYLILEHALQAPQNRSEMRALRDGQITPAERNLVYRTDRGVTGEAVRKIMTVYVPDVWKRATNEYISLLEETRSELAIPLYLGNTVFGVLNIESDIVDAFSLRDRKVAELLAAQAGLAISNVQDYGYTIELLKLVVDSTYYVIGSIEDQNKLIDTILDSALRVTDTEDGYCSLILIDESYQKLKIRREKGDNSIEKYREGWSLSEGITGRAVRNRKPQNVPDTRKDPDYIPAAARTCSNLAVPLFDGNMIIGVLNLESPVMGAFNEQTIEALQQFGSLAVTVLKKNNLVTSLQSQQQEALNLVKRISHLFSMPIQALQARLKDLPLSGKDVESTINYLDLILNWLNVQTEILEHHTEKIQIAPANVCNVVTTATRAYRPQAERKQVKIIDASEGQSIMAVCNPKILQGVLVEVFENALNYARSAIIVRVENSAGTVHISVHDDGQELLSTREWAFNQEIRRSQKNTDEQTSGLSFIHIAMKIQGGDTLTETHVVQDGVRKKAEEYLILRLPTSKDENSSLHVTNPRPVKLFYSYSHEDERLRKQLEKQLATLKQQNVIEEWYDQDISAGEDWRTTLDKQLNTAHIILLLVSPDFLASEYIYSFELQKALEKHESGEALVIPIILRAVDWRNTPMGKLQVLPMNGKPIMSQANRDEAFLAIAVGIRKAINKFLSSRS